ncbi:MAG: hypothetical protein NC217_07520 [Muribaculaceae bacterium]|nr:hypothetical protein [Muribaculaceae bacterium]
MKRPTTAQNIAMSVTVLTAILLLLLLFGVHIITPAPTADKAKSAQAMADPELLEQTDEEMFIEPELVNIGDPDNLDELADDALTPQGEPLQAEVPNDRLVVNGPNPNDNPSPETLVATAKPNAQAKTTPPSAKNKPNQQIASTEPSVNVSFNNGKNSGKGSTAQSGSGNASSGQARGEATGGRKLIAPFPTITGFTISSTTTVTVTVQVKADGSVVPGSAKVIGLKSEYRDLRQKLIVASEKTRWTPKKGAATVQGTITWTLKPGTK